MYECMLPLYILRGWRHATQRTRSLGDWGAWGLCGAELAGLRAPDRVIVSEMYYSWSVWSR